MNDNSLATLKIVIFGSIGVGKTSLLRQLVDGNFSTTTTTIAPDLMCKTYNYDGKIVKLALWDTAGMEKFHSISTNLYRDVQGAVLVYDITNRKSFIELHNWMSNLKDYYEGSEKFPVVIVLGNKVDLNEREVSRMDGLNFAKRSRALFLETSAKTNSGVDTAFDDLITKIMETPGLWKINSSMSVLNFQEISSSQSCGQC